MRQEKLLKQGGDTSSQLKSICIIIMILKMYFYSGLIHSNGLLWNKQGRPLQDEDTFHKT